MTTTASDPFRSARLIYRAVETPEDDRFFQAINDDHIGFQNSNARNIKLPSKQDAAHYQKHVAEETLIGVVICLPAPSPGSEGTAGKPIPIGAMHLSKSSDGMAHHRHSDIGIDLLPQYQGQGYGSEAIRWLIDWGFRRAGLHRIMLRAFQWNTGAVKLYERLGFKREGEWREFLWHEGKWWSDIQLGMLEHEWRAMQSSEHEAKDMAGR